MINLLLLTLSLANPQPAQMAQFKPCVWPNVCKTEAAPVVAQFRPCVWPNVCKNDVAPVAAIVPAVEVAQFTTCVFPRKCDKNA
jgi:hypothetical protein